MFSEEMTFTPEEAAFDDDAEAAIDGVKQDDESLKKSPEEIDKLYSDILGEFRNERGLLKDELNQQMQRIKDMPYDFFAKSPVEDQVSNLNKTLIEDYNQNFGAVGNDNALLFQLGVLRERFSGEKDQINAFLAEKAFKNMFPDRDWKAFMGANNSNQQSFDLLNADNNSAGDQYKLLALYIIDKYNADQANPNVREFVSGKLTLPQLQYRLSRNQQQA